MEFLKKNKIINEIIVTKELTDPIKKNKNLIFFCVFHNEEYMKMFKILMISLKFYSNTDNIDFLIFTSNNFIPYINSISKLVRINIAYKIFDLNNVFDAACARLNIYDYENIDQYEKILYVDTDIIIKNDINILFEEPLEDKMYAVREATIGREHQGGWYFDFNNIDKNTGGMNSGILLFKNLPIFKQIFNDIREHILNIKKENGTFPVCYDQPFVNYHFIKNSKYDITMMEKYGQLYDVIDPLPKLEPTNIIFCHFVWAIGGASNKTKRMTEHLKYVLKYYKSMVKNNEPINEKRLNDVKFNWNNNSFIHFKGYNILETSWGSGLYIWLDYNTLFVTWSGYDHIIKINESSTNYMSIRLADLEISYGVKL